MKRSASSARKPARGGAAAPGRWFGAHLSVAGGVSNALQAAADLRFEAVQIFVKNQRQWAGPPIGRAEVERWNALRARSGVRATVAHATYLINLASADAALLEKSRDAFVDELRRCDQLDVPYLVVHPGAAGDAPPEEALARVSASLNSIFAAHPDLRVMPLLETTAGQGSALGRTFDELGRIIRGLAEPKRVGVCIDTCHVFAAGYDIRDPVAFADMLGEADAQVGLDRVRCWHLNDSKGACGSRIDRHEHLGQGQIGARGFRNLLGVQRFAGTPMILETPKGADARGRDLDAVNVGRLKRWLRAAAD